MIKNGSQVKFHYALTVDGKIVDQSAGRQPLAYQHGSGTIIPGLEKHMEGLSVGDKKQVTVGPKEGYGDFDPQAIKNVSKSVFNDKEAIQEGAMVQGQANGQPIQAVVKEVGEAEVTLDFNHPLAGKTLNFEVEVVEISNGESQSSN